MFLLYPEWQGSGRSPAVQAGARTIARALFPDTSFLSIASPDIEPLHPSAGVNGLQSIAPRFRDALARLREAAPDRIVTIGGTCGVEVAPVGYLNERYAGDLALVWLDAHGDLNTPESSPSGNFHGMVLRTLLGEGPAEYVSALARPLEPRQVFLAGTRDLDPPERDFVAASGISLTPPSSFAQPDDVVRTITSRGFSRVYVHLDLDVLDPVEFPATLVPTAGGPALAEVEQMIRAIAERFDVAGFSIVEYVHGSRESLEQVRRLAEASGIC